MRQKVQKSKNKKNARKKMNVFETPDDHDEISEELSALKLNKNLMEKEFTCLYDELEAKKSENEKKILELRKINTSLREAYSVCQKGDQRVIYEVFRKRGQRELLAMQNSDIGPAIEELDNKLSKQCHELDSIKHVQKRQARELLKLSDEVVDLKTHGDSAYETHLSQIINVRNNEIDKAKVKTDTATYIGRCYTKIRDALEADVNGYPSKISELEEKRKVERGYYDNIKETYTHAVQHQKETTTILGELERTSFSERRKRDLTLMKARKMAEKRLDEFDDYEKKCQAKNMEPKESSMSMKALSLKVFGVDPAAAMAHKQKSADDKTFTQTLRQVHILEMAEEFDQVKDTLQVSDIEGIIRRFFEQKSVHKSLKRQKKERIERLNELRKAIQEVEKQLTEQKYSNGSQDKDAKLYLDKQYKIVETQDKKFQKQREDYQALEKLMTNVKIATVTLFDKVSNVKLKPPNHNYSKANPLEDLMNIQKKLEHIQEDMMSITDKTVIYNCMGPDRLKRFMLFVDSRLPTDQNRFLPDAEENEGPAFFEEELEDRPDYVSYEDMKARSQKIIDLKSIRGKRSH